MMSPEVLQQWRTRLDIALSRWREADRRVRETAIERLVLPQPDGDRSHQQALEDETEALREYKNLLAEFARLSDGTL